jgi:hypothetical protein
MSSEEMSRNFKRWTFRSIRIIAAKTDAYKFALVRSVGRVLNSGGLQRGERSSKRRKIQRILGEVYLELK